MRHPPGAILCLLLSCLISACCSGVYRDPIRTASGQLLCPRHRVPMTMRTIYLGEPGCVVYSREYQRLIRCNPYAKRDEPFTSPVRSKAFSIPLTDPLCPVCQAHVDAWKARQSHRYPP